MYVFLYKYTHRYNIDILLLTHKNIYKNMQEYIWEQQRKIFFFDVGIFWPKPALSFIAAGMSLQCNTVKN